MKERPTRRIQFVDCTVTEKDGRFEATVSFLDGDDPRDAAVSLDASKHTRAWAAAEAAVRALLSAYGLEDGILELKDVVTLQLDGRPAIAASLTTNARGERVNLFGLSQIRADDAQSAVLAVLGATNRFFGSG